MRLWVLAVGLAACGQVDATLDDGGRALPDAAVADRGVPDAARDAAPVDAALDAAPVDAATPDAARDAAPDAAPPPPDPLAPRVDNTTCRLPEAPPVGDFDAVEAFPALDFDRPVWIGAAPGEPDALYVVEQGGRIRAFDERPDVAATTDFLTLTVNRSGNEEGLLGLAFHPRYAENGRFFVYYTGTSDRCPSAAARCSILSEFHRSGPRQADPASERVLLTFVQPFSNHNGGNLAFGPDGDLYVDVGDGGSQGDPFRNGQNTHVLFGKILRLDVDSPPAEGPPRPDMLCDDTCATPGNAICSDGGGTSRATTCVYGTDCTDCGPRPDPDAAPARYAIPPDNPFADGVGGRPEVWAWGFRNPWRASFDAGTGALWVGDVGQDHWEEVDKVTGPGNFGWSAREATACYRMPDCMQDGFTDPVTAYDHGQGQSITGGSVYRGPDWPELWGAYVFGDYATGRIWALRERPGDTPEVRVVAHGAEITSFGTDSAGRLFFTRFTAGQSLMTLQRHEAPAGDPLPRLLSRTGCFSDTASQTPAPGVIPYGVNVPLWSDGADKGRWLALPAGARLGYRADGAWDAPPGTLLIKTFVLGSRRVETRMLARQRQGWRGFTWRWNEAQDDAVLLDGGLDEDIGGQPWHYPTRAECDRCHTEAAGFALGLRTAQLARTYDYGGVTYDQIAALSGAGYLDGAPAAAKGHPRLDDDSAPLEARARALLDVNCAMCHVPGGTASARLDLRASTPLADSGLCDAPGQGDLGLPGARLVTPGDPDHSILWLRMARRGEGQMPPLATQRVDDAGVALLRRWITSLRSCP